MPEYLLRQIGSGNRNLDICMETADCLVTGMYGKKKSYFGINGSLTEFDGKVFLLKNLSI
jgi:hypothetical protein